MSGVTEKVSFTLGTSFVLQVFGAVTGILTARWLGPENKGVLTSVIIWPHMMAAVGSLGLTSAVTYISSLPGASPKKILANAYLLAAVQSMVLFGLGYFFLPVILQNQGQEVVGLALVYLLFIPLNLLILYQQSLMAARLAFRPYNMVRLTYGLVVLVGLIGLAWAGVVTVRFVIWMYLLSNLVTLVVTAVLLVRSGDFSFDLDRSAIPPMLSYGLKAHLTSLSVLVNERLDQLLISFLLLPIMLGYYSVAVTLTLPVQLVGQSIALVALPALAGTPDKEERLVQSARFIRASVWLSIVTGLFLFITSPWLVRLLFGESYLPAYGAARLLSVAAVPLGVNRVLGAVLKANNHPLVAGLAELAAAVFTALALVVILPRFGILGAAAVSLVAYSLAAAYMLVGLARLQLVRWPELICPQRQDLQLLRLNLPGFKR